jgi:MFS family permease
VPSRVRWPIESLHQTLPSSGGEAVSSERRYRLQIGLCALVSVALRFRFVFTPLTADEGGFVAIARAWTHGRDLYSNVWVDRPQGLLVVFALWDRLSWGNTQSVRVMAIVFGVAAVVACATIARSLAGPTAGALAGLFTAVMSSAPAVEGFVANGELLSGTFATVGLAAGCMVLSRRLSPKAMLVSGVAAGLAVSVKQSGFDGYAAIATWLVVAAVFGWRSRRWAASALGWLTAGFAGVITLLAVHGAITGWDDWYYAVAGYRLESRSAVKGADWGRLWETMRDVRPVFLPIIVAAVAVGAATKMTKASREASASRFSSELLVLPFWLVYSAIGFVMGGQFFNHYWVVLTFPVAVSAAAVIASIRWPAARALVAAGVLVPMLWSAATVIVESRSEVPLAVTGYPRSIQEERVGSWFRTHHTTGDSIYIMCASASAYAHADADPPYPYLWFDNVNTIPGAGQRLYDLLSGEDAPTFVAVFQRPDSCALRGEQADVLARDYQHYVTVEGIDIEIRRTDQRAQT